MAPKLLYSMDLKENHFNCIKITVIHLSLYRVEELKVNAAHIRGSRLPFAFVMTLGVLME